MDDGPADRDHPYWVPSFGMIFVLILLLAVGTCCGAAGLLGLALLHSFEPGGD